MWAFIRWADEAMPPAMPAKRKPAPRRARRPSRAAKSELTVIPGVGPSIAADLEGIGIRTVKALERADPQALYDRVCEATGQVHDRCLLYVFRCAVYYASRPVHDPEKLKWWNWKD